MSQSGDLTRRAWLALPRTGGHARVLARPRGTGACRHALVAASVSKSRRPT